MLKVLKALKTATISIEIFTVGTYIMNKTWLHMQICEVGRGTRKISLRVAVDYLENAHITHHSETQQKIYKGYTKEIQTLCNTPHNNF